MRAAPRARIAAVLVAWVLAACSTAPAVPEDRYYRLEVPAPTAGAAPGGTIGVAPVRAGGIYTERALLYAHEGALEQRRFDFWAEAPDQLVEDALLAYLRAAFGAEHVVGEGARHRPDWTVRTRINRLEQLDGDGSQRMSAVFEFEISDADGRVVAVIDSGGERSLAGSGAADFVHGVSAQCADSFAELAARLRTLGSK
jgi:uncharacterized lipoprotein YmbA